jgi:hypothetical protein
VCFSILKFKNLKFPIEKTHFAYRPWRAAIFVWKACELSERPEVRPQNRLHFAYRPSASVFFMNLGYNAVGAAPLKSAFELPQMGTQTGSCLRQIRKT